ncbi:MAG TPA: ABC transporter permease subunit [Myxococcales bacterium]|jgi:ABC-type transport system involved in multi-copper enzyme maturation permease subunit
MNARAIRAIVRKDLRVVLRSKAVLAPVVLLPAFLLVAMPIAIGFIAWFIEAKGVALNAKDPAFAQLLERVPEALRAIADPRRPGQLFAEWVLAHLYAPLFLLVPIVVANVVAADSFAGDKERRTLEALLHTPVSNTDLFLAKLLPAWVMALTVNFVSFVVYTAVADASAWPVAHRLILPTTIWFALAFWAGPAVAALALGSTVLISSRVRGFQEAHQLASMLVLPLTAPIIGQVIGAMRFSTGGVLLVGLFLWVLAGLLLWIGMKTFRRDRFLT